MAREFPLEKTRNIGIMETSAIGYLPALYLS